MMKKVNAMIFTLMMLTVPLAGCTGDDGPVDVLGCKNTQANNYNENVTKDDETCDYGCMAIEYLYWSIATHMGFLEDPDICEGIYNEWELCTPTELEARDVKIHSLITNPEYLLPQTPPDGEYRPQ